MTRLWDSGAEFNTISALSVAPTVLNGGLERLYNDGGANLTFDSTIKHSGTYSFKFDSGAGASESHTRVRFADIGVTPVLGRNYYFRGYWYFPSSSSWPSGTIRIMMAHISGVGGAARVDLTSSGTLYLGKGDSGNQVGSATGVLNKDQWYRVELRWNIGTGAVDECEFRLDGTQIAVTTGQSITDTVPDHGVYFVCPNVVGANRTWNIDTLAFNDDQGSYQNGWCGPAKFGLSLPISDNNRGAWTGGAGGTTNLYQAIDNTPPAGLSTETNTSQIESASNSGTDSGDFNMTTPSTLGMGASDFVNVARLTISHGEDVTTNTKTGSATIVSNPAQPAPDTFTFGNDQATALSNWPSFWVTNIGTTLSNPKVTPSTSPVARVTKTDTTTRVASVCFMGISIEWDSLVTIGTYFGSWTPANLSVTPRAYWLADDFKGLDGDPVGSWLDRSGNAYTLSQSNTTLRPTLQTNELNSHSTIRFDGTDDYLTIGNVLGLTAQPISIFAVWKVAASGQQTLIQANNDTIGHFKTSPNGELANISGAFTLIQPGMSAAGWYITSATHDGTSGQSAINGTTFTGDSGTTVPSTSINVGTNHIPADYLNGDIAVLIVSQTTWSTAERQMLEGWAAHQFGLQSNLPSTHPFKLSPPQYPSLSRRPAGNRAFIRR